MDQDLAVLALAALAHDTRLGVFRLLINQGPDGLAAGRIAERLGVHAATLSAHLAQLERAGLIASRRVARNIFYFADIDGAGRLIGYLTDDCCGGRPEICQQALSGAAGAHVMKGQVS